MTPDIRPLVAGNWKMNGLVRVSERDRGDAPRRRRRRGGPRGTCGLARPRRCSRQAAWKLRGGKLALGGQDCAAEASGAFTGDISAPMLKDAGAAYVIVGHSERRTVHHETDALVRAKAEAALKAGLTPIVCVGETRAEREAGQAVAVVIAAIAAVAAADATRRRRWSSPMSRSGRSAPASRRRPADVAAKCTMAIRALLERDLRAEGRHMRILYGGSVKPANAREFLGLDNVDGALVGGASLKAADFLAIAKAYA